MLAQVHCPVAIYDTLRETISEELKTQALPTPEDQDPVVSAQAALSDLEKTVKELRESITVKKESEATRQRAQSIKRMANDANRTIKLESASL